MDAETREFLSDEFARVHERLDAHGVRLAKHEDSDTAVRSSVSQLTSKVDRIGTYAAVIHDDVKLLLRSHPNL